MAITWEDYGRIRAALDGLNRALAKARDAIKDGDRDAAARWVSRALDHKYFAIKWFPPITVTAHKTLGFDEIYEVFREIDVLLRLPDWLQEMSADERIDALEKALTALRGIRDLNWMSEDADTIERLKRMIRALEKAIRNLRASRKIGAIHSEVLSEKIEFLNEIWDDPNAMFGERIYYEFCVIDDCLMEAQWLLGTDCDLSYIDRPLRYAHFVKDHALKPYLPTPPVELIPPDQGAEDLPKRPNFG